MSYRHLITGRLVRAGSLALGLALALTACQHIPVEKHSTGNPDERLAHALERLDMARAAGRNNNTIMDDERVIVDPGTVRVDIERLAYEFPSHVPILLTNAQLAFEAREWEKAQAYADRVLREQPDNVFGGIMRARIALQDGNIPFARRLLMRQLETAPESPYIYEVLAGVEFLDGRLAEAEQAINHADALGGESWRIAYHRGLIAQRRGNHAQAAQSFQDCLDLRPGYEPARAHLTLLRSKYPVGAPSSR